MDDRVDVAPTSQVTRHSRRAITDVIADHGSATRGEIAERTGLSRATVAAAVTELLTAGSLVEVHPSRTVPSAGTRGRRPGRLTLAGPRGLLCAIDLGHRHIGVAVAQGIEEVLRTEWLDHDVDADPTAALGLAIRRAQRLVHEAGERPLAAVAVTVPQPVDERAASIVSTPFLSAWHELPVVERLAEEFGVPVRIENDANAGALAEVDAEIRSAVFVKVSTGLGMGTVLDGTLVRGSHGQAGEIGHLVVRPDNGQLCGCGNRGCLETLASLPAVVRAVEPVRGRLLPADLRAFLDGGDVVVARALQDAGAAIGTALAPVMAALQVPRLVIDGPHGIPVDAIVRGARSRVEELVHPEVLDGLTVTSSRHGDAASLAGALRLAGDAARPAVG